MDISILAASLGIIGLKFMPGMPLKKKVLFGMQSESERRRQRIRWKEIDSI